MRWGVAKSCEGHSGDGGWEGGRATVSGVPVIRLIYQADCGITTVDFGGGEIIRWGNFVEGWVRLR